MAQQEDRRNGRTAIDKDWDVYGVRHGYAGLTNDDFVQLGHRDVSGIIQRGGTILGSTRYPAFKADEAQVRSITFMRNRGVDALIVIGGDGSQAGAFALANKGFPVVGVASTIDNDVCGSEISIGVDSALNVALEAIDRIKVTACSHDRVFLVEVMGRSCGYLALMAGIAGGAEYIVLPEIESDPESVARQLRPAYEHGKSHAIVVVAEGAKYNAGGLASYFKEHREGIDFDRRVTKLGHVQRGGTPGAFDRLLATRFGATATECVDKGKFGVVVGLVKGEVTSTCLTDIVGKKKALDLSLLKLADVLAQ